MKFSPVTNGLSLLSLDNNEFAQGLWFAWKLRNGHPIDLAFDHSVFRLDTGASAKISYESTTFGVGYGF